MAYLFYSRFWQQTSDIWLFALVVNSLRYHLYFISFIKFSRAHPIVLLILMCVCARAHAGVHAYVSVRVHLCTCARVYWACVCVNPQTRTPSTVFPLRISASLNWMLNYFMLIFLFRSTNVQSKIFFFCAALVKAPNISIMLSMSVLLLLWSYIRIKYFKMILS